MDHLFNTRMVRNLLLRNVTISLRDTITILRITGALESEGTIESNIYLDVSLPRVKKHLERLNKYAAYLRANIKGQRVYFENNRKRVLTMLLAEKFGSDFSTLDTFDDTTCPSNYPLNSSEVLETRLMLAANNIRPAAIHIRKKKNGGHFVTVAMFLDYKLLCNKDIRRNVLISNSNRSMTVLALPVGNYRTSHWLPLLEDKETFTRLHDLLGIGHK